MEQRKEPTGEVSSGLELAIAPWKAEIEQALLVQFGWQRSDPVVARTMDLLCGHLCGSTYKSYSAKFRKFVGFCQQQGLSPLPAEESTVCLYLGWLSLRDTVKAQNFGQYVSAINTVHRDLLLDAPGVGLTVKSLIKGACLAQQGTKASLVRDPLTASQAARILALACSTTQTAALRASVMVLMAFCTMCRGASVLAWRPEDVHFSWAEQQFSVRVTKEKGKQHHGEARLIKQSWKDLPELGIVVHEWTRFRDAAWIKSGLKPEDATTFWSIPGEPAITEGFLNSTMKQVCD